ncbi:DUF4405 domain-containing protein [Aliirhizobium cellulosilyticum]|uniref:Flavinylation-associated cytochrome domain-containing protein n=1 Tax=Aliirhizobium cellulosilyticum TaxID=393664 RepID=A0A7W6SBG2_9HYPH|nr:DUF4405 domain-containing protein [Rhizobium cellulosilyticum]MBB4350726.1 hypothetical protein [Rhizobium cellulosilyticum]MBB4413921.1 hypothetical protein [Rhizobium cellulosilyticum]MBB4448536.1 hypothetical protein [Rhizobium cellulosilyticum]
MTTVFRVRLFLDFLAVALIIACLAYWWLDNLFHEVFGTALFALVIGHNVFNRRWYGNVAKGRRDAVRLFNIFTIVCLAVAMLVMLATSLLISRDLFSFMALDGAFAVREIHMFAGYWTLFIIAIHLGTRWPVVMGTVRSALGLNLPNTLRTIVLRVTALAISIWGVKSSFEMAFGAKLMLTYSLDMWDFHESTLQFFVNYGSIVGLCALVTYYGLNLIRRVTR